MRLNAPWLLLGLVVLASVTACMGDDDDAAMPAGTSAGQPQAAPLQPPSSFTAKPAALRVVLTWEAPAGLVVGGYALFRDGSGLISLDGSTTTFVDEDVAPGQDYTYEIESRLGDQASERISVDTETRVPPVGEARLEGPFDVRTRVESQHGYSEYQRSNFGWRFRPRCDEGPCDVLWNDLHLKRLHATLNRRGDRYSGTLTAPFLIECAGSPSSSRVTIDLRIDAARAVGTEWRATRLVGTLAHSEVAQLGCVASGAELSVDARLVE
jgi:hypothetical protein